MHRSHSPLSLLFVAALLSLGLACGGILGDDDGCKKDTDCKGSRVCTEGKCSAPVATTLPPPPAAKTPARHSGGVYSFDCFGEDFYMTSSAQLRRYKNEIYARHGYPFKSKDMQRYFKAQSWYTPQPGLSMKDVAARFSATDSRCLKRIRDEEKVQEHNLAACPFVYLVEDGEEILQGEILRHINTPAKAGWQSLELLLDGPAPRHIRVRMAEEKPETTFLDAIHVQIDGEVILPRVCQRRQAAFCTEDGRHRRLKPGDTLDFVFELPIGHKGPIHLWASGHYRPH